MKAILIIFLAYILSVVISFIGVWYWNSSYRKKCKTLYQFLFEPEYSGDVSNSVVVFFPVINIMILFSTGFCELTKKIPLNKNELE